SASVVPGKRSKPLLANYGEKSGEDRWNNQYRLGVGWSDLWLGCVRICAMQSIDMLHRIHMRTATIIAPRCYSAAIDTHTSSLSFRANTHLLANAGCDHTTGRFAIVFVGSKIRARLISS